MTMSYDVLLGVWQEYFNDFLGVWQEYIPVYGMYIGLALHDTLVIHLYPFVYNIFVIFVHLYTIYLYCVYSQSHLGWQFRMLFQSSKLKARLSLFTETWQKRRSSFELSKMSPQVGLGVSPYQYVVRWLTGCVAGIPRVYIHTQHIYNSYTYRTHIYTNMCIYVPPNICVWCTTTGRRRPIECLQSQVIFRKRATNHRALLRKMTYQDKASYDSTPPCSTDSCHEPDQGIHIICVYTYTTHIYTNMYICPT